MTLFGRWPILGPRSSDLKRFGKYGFSPGSVTGALIRRVFVLVLVLLLSCS